MVFGNPDFLAKKSFLWWKFGQYFFVGKSRKKWKINKIA